MSDINDLIATSSQEQLSVTEDIARSTNETLMLVHDNAQAVEDSKQASEELARLAVLQKSEMSFFKI